MGRSSHIAEEQTRLKNREHPKCLPTLLTGNDRRGCYSEAESIGSRCAGRPGAAVIVQYCPYCCYANSLPTNHHLVLFISFIVSSASAEPSAAASVWTPEGDLISLLLRTDASPSEKTSHRRVEAPKTLCR